jgi:signal peptidase I
MTTSLYQAEKSSDCGVTPSRLTLLSVPGGRTRCGQPPHAWPPYAAHTGKRSTVRELPILIGVALVLSLLIKTFLVQAFFIPSESMEKTLHGCAGCTGDRILVEKISYDLHDPRPGDIVVFRAPSSWEPETQVAPTHNPLKRALNWVGGAFGLPQANEKDLVKRVIAVGGQTVRCCDAQGRVTVDGQPLTEPYVYEDDHRPFGPVTVPRGRLWVMGDHRSDSADSRFHLQDGYQGTIPVKSVIGRAFVIIWPPSRMNTLGNNLSRAAPSG